MKSKIIKSKLIRDGVVELIKFEDNFGKIIKYEIALGCMQKGVAGGGVGEFKKIEEFESESEAINFFNNQI